MAGWGERDRTNKLQLGSCSVGLKEGLKRFTKFFAVATRWRFSDAAKSRPEGRLSQISDKSAIYLVAGIGFEPMTFRL
jgi:hypothetical protein